MKHADILSSTRNILERSIAGSPAKQRFFSDAENAPPLKSPRMKDGKLQNYRELVMPKGSKSATKRKPLASRNSNNARLSTGGTSSKIPVFSPSRPVSAAKKASSFGNSGAKSKVGHSKALKKSKSARGAQEDCSSCKKLHSEMINAQEDMKEYQRQYTRIQQEGARLYEVYELKVKKLAEHKDKISELESFVETNQAESESIREQYDEIFDAYNELVERFKALRAEKEEKEEEATELNERILKLINSQQSAGSGVTELQMNEQARALMKQTETFKREAAALQEEVSRQKDQFEQKLEEAESSFELRQQEFTEKIEQLSLQTELEKQKSDGARAAQEKAEFLLESSSATLKNLQEHNESMSSDNKELQRQLEQKDEKLEAMKSEMNKMLNQLDKAASLKREKEELEEFFQEEQAANMSCVAELQTKIQNAKSRAEKTEAELTELKMQAEEYTFVKQESDAAIESLRSDCETVGLRTKELAGELHAEKQIKAAAQRDLAEAEAKNSKLLVQCEEQSSRIEFLTSSLKEVEASLAEATNEMVDREAEWEMLASQQREDSRNKIERVVSEAASKEQETSQRLCRSLADLETALQKVSEGNKDNIALKRTIQELKTLNAETEAASRESQDELKETQTILNNQRQKHLALREELKQLKQKLAGVEDERDQIERRVAQHKQTASKKTKELESMTESANKWREHAARAEGRYDALVSETAKTKKMQQTQKNQLDEAGEKMQASISKFHHLEQQLEESKAKLRQTEENMDRIKKDKENVKEQMSQLVYHWDQQDIPREKAVHKILQEKFELEKKLKQAQVTEKSSNAATKQLRHYLLLYKQKADEKQTLTEETLAQQESLIKTLDGRLRRVALIGSRFSGLISSEPELAGAFSNLNSVIREVDEQGTVQANNGL